MKILAPTAMLLTTLLLQTVTPAVLAAYGEERAPNILLVIADDMGLDATNCYNTGNRQAPMPTLEALCDNGLVFDNAYAAPVCSPTRASIMSGQHGFQNGVGGAVSRRGDSGGLSDSVVSLFDLLSATNYSAALIGKWHLASAADGLNHPAALGIDHYFGLYSGRTADYSNWQAVNNGTIINVQDYTTSAFTDQAVKWIQSQSNPWFLWLAHNAPHAPFHLPPKDLHRFDTLADNRAAIDKNPLPYFQAMLEAMDTELGRLLDSLPAEDRDNTLVIFIGDNGTPNQVASSDSQQRAKGSLYEAGIHVPLVVAGAGIDAGRTDEFVSAIDLYATIASLAGISSEAPASYDFSKTFSGGSTNRDYIYAEHFSDRPARRANTYGWALRQGNMKLIDFEDGSTALYDLNADPKETNNLLAPASNEHAAIANALRKRKNTLVRSGF